MSLFFTPTSPTFFSLNENTTKKKKNNFFFPHQNEIHDDRSTIPLLKKKRRRKKIETHYPFPLHHLNYKYINEMRDVFIYASQDNEKKNIICSGNETKRRRIVLGL